MGPFLFWLLWRLLTQPESGDGFHPTPLAWLEPARQDLRLLFGPSLGRQGLEFGQIAGQLLLEPLLTLRQLVQPVTSQSE